LQFTAISKSRGLYRQNLFCWRFCLGTLQKFACNLDCNLTWAHGAENEIAMASLKSQVKLQTQHEKYNNNTIMALLDISSNPIPS